MNNQIIISRHPAAIEFIKGQGIEAPVIEQATAEDVRGKIVYGNVPLHLAAIADRVVAIEFAGDPPRGREYTEEDMRRAGAHLVQYSVSAI